MRPASMPIASESCSTSWWRSSHTYRIRLSLRTSSNCSLYPQAGSASVFARLPPTWLLYFDHTSCEWLFLWIVLYQQTWWTHDHMNIWSYHSIIVCFSLAVSRYFWWTSLRVWIPQVARVSCMRSYLRGSVLYRSGHEARSNRKEDLQIENLAEWGMSKRVWIENV